MNISIERKKGDCSALPKGWQREEVFRKTGKVDVYYISPTGKKVESKPQLVRQLGDAMDLSSFDYQTGRIITNSHNMLFQRSALKRKLPDSPTSPAPRHQFADYSRGGMRTDVSLVPPIRQTASIFKQPVTVYKTQEGKVKSDLKHGSQDKPKQLFWEKRLEGLRACDINGIEFSPIELTKGLKPVGPNVNETTLLQSIATSLHVSSHSVTGQTASKANLSSNPGVFLNIDQPLMYSYNITEDDINRQEYRVSFARKKLQDALRA